MSTGLIFLAVILACGLLALAIRMPPLVGFLAAGFVLNGLGVPELDSLDVISELGVTLMLFAIGLKLDVRQLFKRKVWFTALAHMGASVIVGTGFLVALASLGIVASTDVAVLMVLALVLSFSSTVFVVKVLQDRGDEQALYGRITIGVLVMQDIVAVAIMSVSRGAPPRPLTLGLVVVLPLIWLLVRRLPPLGHGEMQALFGIFMALVPGYALFDWLGLGGNLGALVMGMLLAAHAGAQGLSNNLFLLKELLLVGFFVSIGFTGVPTWGNVAAGLLLLLMLPLQAAGYWALLWVQGMRHRTSLLTGVVLANYSEFSLIVAAVGVGSGWLEPYWLLVLSIAVATSFVVSSMLNPSDTYRWSQFALRFRPHPASRLHPADRPIEIGDARALVLGMGRVGKAAYDALAREHGYQVLGIEHDPQRVELLWEEGYTAVEADATDNDIWDRIVRTARIEVILLAMPSQHANVDALRQIRRAGYRGTVAGVATYYDNFAELEECGIDAIIHLYEGAGESLADRAVQALGHAG